MASPFETTFDTPVSANRISRSGNGDGMHFRTPLEALQGHYAGLISEAGEDGGRDGLLKTPERAAKAWQFLTSGYDADPRDILASAVFEEDFQSMVLIKDVEFYSMCEHHLLPFYGKAHIAYIPDGRIVGLSKVPRMLDAIARRLQVQERMTKEAADAMIEALQPLGVAVWIEASHMCMMMRGVEKQGSSTATSHFTGVFESDDRLRSQFLSGIGKG